MPSNIWTYISDKDLEDIKPDSSLAERVRRMQAEHEGVVQIAYRAAAFETHNRDGEIEIDDDATISLSDGTGAEGAYVQAWVWVYDSAAGLATCTRCRHLAPLAAFAVDAAGFHACPECGYVGDDETDRDFQSKWDEP